MTNNGPFKRYIIEAITSVKDKIDKNPLEKREITQLALDAGIGRNVLQKGFRYLFGSSIKEYVQEKRMEIAKELLEEGRLTRKQIAHKLGYRMPGNFSVAFKKRFGFSPNGFRRQYNEAI